MGILLCLQELDLFDVQSIDPEVGRTLLEMQVIVRRKQFLENSPNDERKAIDALRFRESTFEDLCVDFTLPGYPDYTLKLNGADKLVRMPYLINIFRVSFMGGRICLGWSVM